jgi:hypothetical protein
MESRSGRGAKGVCSDLTLVKFGRDRPPLGMPPRGAFVIRCLGSLNHCIAGARRQVGCILNTIWAALKGLWSVIASLVTLA